MHPAKTFDTVLIIDDSNIERYLLSAFLKKNRCAKEIIEFDFAAKALNYLHLNHGEMKFKRNLIFLDINMPGMDGFAFLEFAKDLINYTNGNTIVYMYSVSVSEQDRTRALKYPFVKKFITKPFVNDCLHISTA